MARLLLTPARRLAAALLQHPQVEDQARVGEVVGHARMMPCAVSPRETAPRSFASKLRLQRDSTLRESCASKTYSFLDPA